MTIYAKQHQDNLERLNAALEQGLAFAHQIEFKRINFPDAGTKTKNGEHKLVDMVEVMNGNPEYSFSADYRKVVGSEDGYRCMATTFLHENLKIGLYAVQNRVGLIFDGRNSDEFKCIFADQIAFASKYSDISKKLIIDMDDDEMKDFKNVKGISDLAHIDHQIDLNIANLDQLNTMARKRINNFISEKLESSADQEHMYNEVDAHVKLSALCAINLNIKGIILNPAYKDSAHANEFMEHSLNVLETFALKAFMKENYNMVLPIMTYNQSHDRNRMQEVNIGKDVFQRIMKDVRENSFRLPHWEDLDNTFQLAKRGFELQSKVLEGSMQK